MKRAACIAAACAIPLALLAACDAGGDALQAEGPANSLPAAASPSASEQLLTRYIATDPQGPLAPRDECASIDGAQAFRIALAEAVTSRDADALLALAASDVMLDFGGGAGQELLRQRLTAPEYRLWQALEALLPLGCAVQDQGRLLVMPWYFAQDTRFDAFESFIVIGAGVPMHEAPDGASERVATLAWEEVEWPLLDNTLVQEPGEAQQPRWANVWLKREGEVPLRGYVAVDRLRGIIDWRLLAERIDGQWRVTMLIAGD